MSVMKKLNFFLIAIALLFLSGCCSLVQCPQTNLVPLRPCEPTVTELEEQGVQVIQKGDTLRVILYSDNFFKGLSTTDIKPYRVPTLAKVAKLLRCGCYANYPVHVTGYTDNVGTPNERRARAKEQAQTIAAYLWNFGIPVQRLRVQGAGARDVLSTNMTNLGSSDNRRVELTLP